MVSAGRPALKTKSTKIDFGPANHIFATYSVKIVPEHQLVGTRKTGCSLHLDGSSLKCVPALSVSVQETGIQSCWSPLLSNESNSTPPNHLRAGSTNAKGNIHPPITISGQKQLSCCSARDRSQQSTPQCSSAHQETSGLLIGSHFQSSSCPPSLAPRELDCQLRMHFTELEETASDWEICTLHTSQSKAERLLC